MLQASGPSAQLSAALVGLWERDKGKVAGVLGTEGDVDQILGHQGEKGKAAAVLLHRLSAY